MGKLASVYFKDKSLNFHPPSNPNGYDVGEYIRAVFDNFEYSCTSNSEECKKSELLRAHFPGWSSVEGYSVSTHFKTRRLAESLCIANIISNCGILNMSSRGNFSH